MVIADLIALPLALWSGYALRFAEWWPVSYMEQALELFILIPFVGVVIFTRLGLYRAIVRFMGAQAILSVCKGVLTLAVLLWAGAILLQIQLFPRSVPIIFALAALVYVGGSRLLVRSYYHWLLRNYINKEPVLIYGAGGSGVQLAAALGSGAEFLPVGFLDDDKGLWKSTVNGLPVYDPENLQALIDDLGISYVLLALPSIGKTQRREILERLADHGVHVKTIPNMSDIISGESVDSLRDVEPEDLLGRDAVPADPTLIGCSINNKVVLVSGAGGSIGAEICRQVIENSPTSLVLYEMCEFALYTIEKELQKALLEAGKVIPIYSVLGNVLDDSRVRRVIQRFKIDTIYHAAAYKHVPMVEHNIFEGIRNNAFGTRVIARAAFDNGVERFVLISTDKAVRPTNIMGATKRLAELILQDLANKSDKTVFSMVRFGNVLGSSGSVVPLFRQQISSGGPVTVTHPEITRFFMTIPEAASLVIQAGSMAKGGDVFVLDMGQPVKITELAERMIKLMGFEIKRTDVAGGIEISYSGLRPGEKLYEELLIGEDVIGTEHAKIMRAQEERLTHEQLHKLVEGLERAILKEDSRLARELLENSVSGFKPSSPLVDWLQNQEGVPPSLH
ncbi:probable polysaccharide biosynthesis protein [Oceanospirillum sp. MED92]|uniref:Probable polysaccharide biosynthesis protein n=2 Tax=Neptuniibacter caesariensis TaxID=207954 RepID=A0A7U8C3F9_NEPCE|nr:probable polysaccharide biosynthesis protein [Oceanospirillum sp. MED92] [Neptuniibacter caesariensis]